MIGYLFEPDAEVNGCKVTWIYINDLKGSLPGMLVQMLATKMQKKGFHDMTIAMKKYKNGELNLDDENKDIIYKEYDVSRVYMDDDDM